MQRVLGLALVLMLAGLTAACTEPQRYPVTGVPCGPDDPVKSVDANMADCVPNL